MSVLVMQGNPDWFIGRRTWHGVSLEKLEEGARLSPEEMAESIRNRLTQMGLKHPSIVLGLAAESCLPAKIVLERSSDARDKTVLKYTLEESLPLAAEDMEADFRFVGSSGLGIAVSADQLATLVNELEKREIVVQAITPTTLLAVQSCISECARGAATVVIWQDDDRVDLVTVERSYPCSWTSIAAASDALERELQVMALGLGKPVTVVAQVLAAPLLATVEEMLPVRRPPEPMALREAAMVAASNVSRGRLTPWFDFRRGRLEAGDPKRPIRGVLRLLSLSAAVFLICLSFALWTRASRFREQMLALQEEQAKVYQQAFPNERLPLGIRSRLESEVAKLAGRTGQGERLPSAIPTLRLLRDFLLSLPKDMRYRVVDLRIEEGKLSLEIEVRSHTDADVIAAALRARGFSVEQPRSEQLPQQGVAVRLTAIAPQAPKGGTGA